MNKLLWPLDIFYFKLYRFGKMWKEGITSKSWLSYTHEPEFSAFMVFSALLAFFLLSIIDGVPRLLGSGYRLVSGHQYAFVCIVSLLIAYFFFYWRERYKKVVSECYRRGIHKSRLLSIIVAVISIGIMVITFFLLRRMGVTYEKACQARRTP